MARIGEIEALMCDASFWSDSNKAQAMIKELQELKDFVPGKGKYDSGDAVMTIFAGQEGMMRKISWLCYLTCIRLT